MKLSQNELIPLPSDVGALANRINKATHTEHNDINKFISRQVKTVISDYNLYRQSMASLYNAFSTVESRWHEIIAEQPYNNTGARVKDILQKVYTPEMMRSKPLYEDLMFFYHGASAEFLTPKFEQQVAFRNHIIAATSNKPYLILAYAHVMYLALFAGGRILGADIAKADHMFEQVYQASPERGDKFSPEDGMHLFKFNVEDSDALRVDYKARYELATRNALTEQEKLEIIEEAKLVFSSTLACFREIGQNNKKLILARKSKEQQGSKVLIGCILFFLALFVIIRRL